MYDTSVPTIVPTSIADAEAIVPAPEVVAEASTGAKDRAAFAMLRPVDEQLLSSNTKMRIVKPRHQVRIVRKRVPAPRLAMAAPCRLAGSEKAFGKNSSLPKPGQSRPCAQPAWVADLDGGFAALWLVLQVEIRQPLAVPQHDLPLGLAEEAEDALAVEL